MTITLHAQINGIRNLERASVTLINEDRNREDRVTDVVTILTAAFANPHLRNFDHATLRVIAEIPDFAQQTVRDLAVLHL